MILKGSQRGGPRQLAVHLMKVGKLSDKDNEAENDHVTLVELRGFVSNDIYGAMAETLAVARGTKCDKCVFSLSMNPPKDAELSTDAFIEAADRVEEALGLMNQPRAIVIHEKYGRRHAHVVISRIKAETMKAINLPFFKLKLKELSKEFFLENGWELPEGHKANGWRSPLNFSLAEWQQAKRQGIDPREVKAIFQQAWQRSDNLASFRNALEEHGYFIAKGDRRGFVALDLNGEVYSLTRFSGVKTKELESRLGTGQDLPGVSQVKEDLNKRVSKKLRAHIAEAKQNQQNEMKPLVAGARRMALGHRAERQDLQQKQDKRWQQENKTRASRFKRGLGAVLDVLTGRLFTLRRQNEKEAFAGYLRDRSQREQLFSAQFKERAALQTGIDKVRLRQRQERSQLAQDIGQALRLMRRGERQQNRQRDQGPEFGM